MLISLKANFRARQWSHRKAEIGIETRAGQVTRQDREMTYGVYERDKHAGSQGRNHCAPIERKRSHSLNVLAHLHFRVQIVYLSYIFFIDNLSDAVIH